MIAEFLLSALQGVSRSPMQSLLVALSFIGRKKGPGRQAACPGSLGGAQPAWAQAPDLYMFLEGQWVSGTRENVDGLPGLLSLFARPVVSSI